MWIKLGFVIALVFCEAWGNKGDDNKFSLPPKKLVPEGEMPVIGLGTSTPVGDDLEKGLDAALKSGYRLIDTAYLYGNEKIIGDVLKKWLDSGKIKRQDLFVSTKLPPQGLRNGGVEKYMKKSLELLGLDYVDLYLIHSPIGLNDVELSLNGKPTKPVDKLVDLSTDLKVVWKEMEEQVDAGRTKAIGLSSFNSSQIQRILDIARIPPTNLQIEMHLYLQQNHLLDFSKMHNITVTAFSPIGAPYKTTVLNNNGKKEEIARQLDNPAVKEIAKKHGKSSAQILLRHLLQKGAIVIPRSTNPKRLNENLDVFDFELDSDDMNKLNAQDKGGAVRIHNLVFLPEILDHPEYPFRSHE